MGGSTRAAGSSRPHAQRVSRASPEPDQELASRRRARMFTGIVAELGEVAGVDHHGDAARLTIRGSTEGVALGESIAVNGVCLTVTGILGGTFTADVMGETLNRSGLGALTPGDPVNLEHSVRLADRMGGHLVQGHVDGVGTLISRELAADGSLLVRIEAPA